MSDLLSARAQMAMSLAFHIVFAVIAIAMPLFMVVAEGRWLRLRDPAALELTRRWARGTAILFAVGAVSGTVLSFELGLLWPRFMAFAGPIVSLPFALEGFAFFLEAIAIGVYLYGWNRVPPVVHWLAGAVIAFSGGISAVFVVSANAWMNAPSGFHMANGRAVDVDPVAAMMNPAAFPQALHMMIAAYQAVGFAVAGIHAALLRRDPTSRLHREAFAITFTVAAVASILQPISGDWNARHLAHAQPVKLAAMEGQFRTQRGAPLRIGGLPDERNEVTHWAIEVPRGLSLLAYHDPNAVVHGLEEVPRRDRPPVAITHVSFQVMVAAGSVMALVGIIGGVLAWRRRALPVDPWFLRLVALCTPLGFVAIEAGWAVTEVGRQPWIVYGVMRTSDAVTPLSRIVIPLLVFTALYVFLGWIIVQLMRRMVFATAREEFGHGA